MNKFLFAACIGIIFGTISFSWAEAPKGSNLDQIKSTTPATSLKRPYNPAIEFDRFVKDLQLNQVQKASIKSILDDLEMQLLPFKNLDFQRRGRLGAKPIQAHYQQIKDLLSAEQISIFDEMVNKGRIASILQ